jgi:hypothetical protein
MDPRLGDRQCGWRLGVRVRDLPLTPERVAAAMG